mgnify:CR=1 FL=1
MIATCEAWTGDRPPHGCPWRAFFELFVARIRDAHAAWEKGNIGWALPNASHRTVEGVKHFDRVVNRCEANRMEAERKERERARG